MADFMNLTDCLSAVLVGVRWMEGSKSPSNSGEGNRTDGDDDIGWRCGVLLSDAINEVHFVAIEE
jgi:hypothetical protein